MAEIDSITIPELATGNLTKDSLIPFSVPGGEMKKTTAQDIAGLLNTVVDIRKYGVVGNGIKDDTAAFRLAMADLPNVKELVCNNLNILLSIPESNPVIISANDVKITGTGSTINNAVLSNIAAIILAGRNIEFTGFTVDGGDKSLNVLCVGDTAQDIYINNVIVKNNKQNTGDVSYAVGILVKNGSKNVYIDHCRVQKINSPITGIARGVLASGYSTDEASFYNLNVTNCSFEDITPVGDADAIVFQPDSVGSDISSSVISCTFKNCAKRAVKVMGSNVTVLGNNILLNGGYSGISAYGNNMNIADNIITGGTAGIGIELGSTVSGVFYGDNSIIKGNIIRMTDNTLGSDGVRTQTIVNNITISLNTIDNIRNGIMLSSSGKGVAILSNVISRTFQTGVNNFGYNSGLMTGVSVIGNTFNQIATSFKAVNSTEADGWLILGNAGDITGANMGGANAKATFLGNVLPGSRTIKQSSGVPTSGTWAVGEMVFNNAPVAGGNAGWQCVAAGSPGTWQMFGELKDSTTSFPLGGTTGNRPTGTKLYYLYYDTTLGGLYYWNGTVWGEITPNAGLSNRGMVLKSASLSTAASTVIGQTSLTPPATYSQSAELAYFNDITALVTQYNTLRSRFESLVTNLKAAGIQA